MKHSWDKENWDKKDDLYYKKEIQDYNSPNVGKKPKDKEGLESVYITMGESRTHISSKMRRGSSLYRPRYGRWTSHWDQPGWRPLCSRDWDWFLL